MNHSQYNVFIFNFNENNKQDLEYLQKTFKDLDCEVRLHNRPDYEEFQEAVEYIRTKKFEIFEYVVFVVLANTNPGSDVLHTRDERIVFINRDLICRAEFNADLRNNDKKLLVLLQTNDNPLDDKEQLEKDNPIHPLNQQLGECFSAASLEYCKAKQQGITIRISAAEYDERLENEWSGVDPPVSKFIQAFCDSFSKHAEKDDINDVFCEMHDLIDSTKPSLEAPTGYPELIFGKPVRKPHLKKLYIKRLCKKIN